MKTPSSSSATTAPADNKDDKYAEQDSNFTLGYLMLGKCWQRLGEPEKAKAMFDRVRQLRPDLANLASPDLNEHSNVLLVVDWGHGPQKVTNYDGAIVGFGPTPAQAGPIFLPRVVGRWEVDADGQYCPAAPGFAGAGAGPAVGEHRHDSDDQDNTGNGVDGRRRV